MLEPLVAAQVAAGHRVEIVADRASEALAAEEPYHGARIRRHGFSRALESGDLGAMRAAVDGVARLKREFRPDVIHVHFCGVTSWFNLLTESAHPAPTLLTLHASQGLQPDMTRRILKAADRITTVSSGQIAEIAALDRSLEAKAVTVPCGLAPPAELPRPLPWAPPRLLCLGRLVSEKGFDIALRALPELLTRWPGLQMIVAGDGPARPDLMALAAELGLENSVDFRGWVEPAAVPALINQATVVLIPSRWREPFGLVALEAAHLARPVVASRVGGLPEAFGEGGLLVAPEDPPALAAGVRRLLDSPAGPSSLASVPAVASWRISVSSGARNALRASMRK